VTRKRQRLIAVLLALALLGGAAALVLNAFSDSLVFFYSPTDLAAKPVPAGRTLRVGGLVEEGSVKRDGDGITIHFVVTDLAHTLPVIYRGVLPDLFREGQGVVAEGKIGPDGVFRATSVLAKHDERYMPPEVAAALKRSGEWRGPAESDGGATTGAAAAGTTTGNTSFSEPGSN
jgi:cytochrome c-type biogenesis protein CcmE